MYKIAVLVGSTNANSVNLKFAKALEKLAAGRLQFNYIKIDDLPFYDDALWQQGPNAVTRFKQEILDSDGVLIVTPEFNRSFPAILKNAIDWASRPYGQNAWADKPAAITGTTPGATGTTQAQAHLRSIMTVLGVALMGSPEVYFQSKPGLINDDYEVTDETTLAFLQNYMTKFANWVAKINHDHLAVAAAE
jgi:chromate reductase